MEIDVYGVLTQEWTRELRDQLRKVPAGDPIELHIASPGGSVAAGVAAYNLLKDAPQPVHAYLEGDAFSAATLVLSAADYAEAPSNVLLMIHDPWLPAASGAVTIKDAERDLRYLKATKAQALDIYEARTKLSRRKLSRMMADETYLEAEPAQQMGFLDTVIRASGQVMNLVKAEDYQSHVRDRAKLQEILSKRRIPKDISQTVRQYGGK